MTFIDYFSHRKWLYSFKSKSDAFYSFVEFKAQSEKEYGHYVKVLWSNNYFISACRKNDTNKKHTTSYTLQKNGVSERKNMTIVKMAKSTMKA